MHEPEDSYKLSYAKFAWGIEKERERDGSEHLRNVESSGKRRKKMEENLRGRKDRDRETCGSGRRTQRDWSTE